MSIECAKGTAIKWSDIHEFGESLNAVNDKLETGVPNLSGENKLFQVSSFRGTTIKYCWHFQADTVLYPCTEITDHGILFEEGFDFETGEKHAYDLERLCFVGAAAGSGENANDPCFCCVTGKVVAGGRYHQYALSQLDHSACTTSPDYDHPCMHFFSFNVPVEMGGTRFPWKEVEGMYPVEFPICKDGDTYVANYLWVASSGKYRLARIDLPLNGFFGWQIRKSDFNDIKNKISEILEASCGAVANKLQYATTSLKISDGNKVKLKDLVYSVINAPEFEGYNDAGCLKAEGSNWAEALVALPWVEPTCQGEDCTVDGSFDSTPKVYCNTMKNLEEVIKKMSTVLKKKNDKCRPAKCDSIRDASGNSYDAIFNPDTDAYHIAYDDGELHLSINGGSNANYNNFQDDFSSGIEFLESKVGDMCGTETQYLKWSRRVESGVFNGVSYTDIIHDVVVKVRQAYLDQAWKSSAEIKVYLKAYMYDHSQDNLSEMSVDVLFNCLPNGKIVGGLLATGPTCPTELGLTITIYDDGSFTIA